MRYFFSLLICLPLFVFAQDTVYLSRSATLYESPNMNAKQVIQLNEGSAVQPVDTVGIWVRVRTGAGVGYIDISTIRSAPSLDQPTTLVNPDGILNVPYITLSAGRGFSTAEVAGESSDNSYPVFRGGLIYPASENMTFGVIAVHKQDEWELGDATVKQKDTQVMLQIKFRLK